MALNRTAEDVEAKSLLSQSRRHNQKEARNKDKVPLSSAPIRIQTKNHSNKKRLKKKLKLKFCFKAESYCLLDLDRSIYFH